MRISEAFSLYRADVIVYGNQSRKTEETHNHACKLLLQFLGDIEVEQLTFDQVRDWKDWLSKGRGNDTVREYIIRLRVVLRRLGQRGIPVMDYSLIGLPKRIDKVPEFLTKEQVSQLIRCVSRPVRGYPKLARYRNAAIISLFYASGIRASELLSLNKSSIKADGTFTVVGKGNKVRLCFIDERTRLYLEEYLYLRGDNNPALFISHQTGGRLSKSGLQLIFARAQRLVDFNVPIHPHILRHSFATDLLRNNTNMRYVQTLLGHSSIQTTQMYTHVVDEDLREVYNSKHKI